MSVFLNIKRKYMLILTKSPKIIPPASPSHLLPKSFGMFLPNPSVRVQHVDGGVPLVLQHLVEGEDVLVVPVVAEVGVLDATVSNTLLGGFKLFRGQNLIKQNINQSINQQTNYSINQQINQFI